MSKLLNSVQPLGRALMLPIAVLPIAGLLLRLGQPDLLDVPLLSQASQAIFSNLGLLFAIGVATGFARDSNGAAALAAVVGYLVVRDASQTLITVPAEALAAYSGDALVLAGQAYREAALRRLDVPVGILSGLIGGVFYNRLSTVKLPEYLAFFAGRRLVPIATGLAGLAIAAVVGTLYPHISAGIDALSVGITKAGPIGLFVFGCLNRLLLVTGLHHILNNVAWFVVGHYGQASGDLPRFFAGDPSAGGFMAGFFPIMMFGLPAACLAMYHAAAPHRRKEVGGMLFSLALTSLLTGVTEPIEFSFMFLAPVLYLAHAVLTGMSMALMSAMGVHLGFGFSAGLLDYVINFGKATRPLMLLPVGLAFGALYYGLFRIAIARFDLPTPGREAEEAASDTVPPANSDRGEGLLRGVGGAGNVVRIDACTTRLRLGIVDQALVDERALKALGSRGVIRPTPTTLQIVLGPIADTVAAEMRIAAARSDRAIVEAEVVVERSPCEVRLRQDVVAALGGAANVTDVHRHFGRVRVRLQDSELADEAALSDLPVKLHARLADGWMHLLFHERLRGQLLDET